jgi:hypothetical protein
MVADCGARHQSLYFSENNGKGGQTFSWEGIAVTFWQQANLSLAHIEYSGVGVRQIGQIINRRTTQEYRKIIIDGYPPWYVTNVKNIHDVEFKFPSLEKDKSRNLERGGWIVAIGLGDLDGPLPYYSKKLAQIEKGRRGGEGPYKAACEYVRAVIEERFINGAFPDNNDQSIITTARRAIRYMIEEHTLSGTQRFLNECSELMDAYDLGAFTASLTSKDIEAVIDIFNSREPLDGAEIDFLKINLKPVMAGAMRGLRELFAYFNDLSCQVPSGVEKLIEDNPEIYLEGC